MYWALTGDMMVGKTNVTYSDYVVFKTFLFTLAIKNFHQVVCCDYYAFVNTDCSLSICEFIVSSCFVKLLLFSFLSLYTYSL